MNSSERSQSVNSSGRSQSVSSSGRSQSVSSSGRSQSGNSSGRSQSASSSGRSQSASSSERSQSASSSASSESRNVLEVCYERNVVGEVDLLRYRNYEGLVNDLSNMSGGATIKYAGGIYGDGHSNVYTLTYKDNDEDWMMVGDIPWDDFVSTAQALILWRQPKPQPSIDPPDDTC